MLEAVYAVPVILLMGNINIKIVKNKPYDQLRLLRNRNDRVNGVFVRLFSDNIKVVRLYLLLCLIRKLCHNLIPLNPIVRSCMLADAAVELYYFCIAPVVIFWFSIHWCVMIEIDI